MVLLILCGWMDAYAVRHGQHTDRQHTQGQTKHKDRQPTRTGNTGTDRDRQQILTETKKNNKKNINKSETYINEKENADKKTDLH